MKSWNAFREVPLSSVTPEGWLRRFLEVQRDGLTGHLEAAGFPFNTRGWATREVKHETGTYWWPYEQTAYWVDGMIRCGRLIGDGFLVQKAKAQIDYVLARAHKDGYLGPSFLKVEDRTKTGWQYSFNRWPHVIFFRALIAEYGATGNRDIVRALHKHYLGTAHSHSDQRDALNIEIMIWLYHQTGDRRMLKLALRTFDAMNRRLPDLDTSLKSQLSAKRPTEHGVSYCESAKLGAILYGGTGDKKHLRASVNAIGKMERFSMLVDGIPSASEKLRGKDPLDSHEACVISDFTWSCGYLLMATGEARYADLIERACFNAGPGAVKKDFRAAQYFSCPNQVVSDKSSNHNLFFRGHIFMRFAPNPATECCAGNVNRFMPNFAARMWMRGADDEIIAALYGPGRLTTQVGKTPVTIVEETSYPFSDHVELQVRTPAPAAFGLTVRIPGWCRKARVLVNGRPLKRRLSAGTFVTIRRTFTNNDRVTLVLPMTLKLTHWPHGGIAVERGPLVYALKINERWVVDKSETKKATREFPAWGVYAESPWNYALELDEKTLAERVEVVKTGAAGDPWRNPPILLRVPARRVRGWQVEARRVVRGHYGGTEIQTRRGRFMLTPQLPDPATLPRRLSRRRETVTLVPYGSTHLRISVFPQAK